MNEQQRKAMKLALEALELCNGSETVEGVVIYTDLEIAAIKEALAKPEQEQIYCKDKRENNGTCPHHNLQCGWPKCNEPEQGFVGCIPSHWVDKAKQIADGPIAYPNVERAQQAIALIKILLKSTPQPAQRKPLTTQEIRKWWASENGLEDCDMAKLDDFEQVVRSIEAAHGIKENT